MTPEERVKRLYAAQDFTDEGVAAAIENAVAAERERCAKIAEQLAEECTMYGRELIARTIAAKIREDA